MINYKGGINESVKSSRYETLTEKEKFARNQYEEQVRALEGITSKNKPVNDFKFTTYNEVAQTHDIYGMSKELNMMKDIAEKTGGTIHAYDLETLGSYAANASDKEKAMAMITEFAVVKQDFVKGAKGINKKDTEVVASYLFGVGDAQHRVFRDLISRAQEHSWDLLSDVEKSTIQRLGLYSDSTKFVQKGKFWNVTGLAEGVDPKDLGAALTGLQNLYKKPGQTQAWGSKGAKELMAKAQQDLANAKLVATFNGKNYDDGFRNAAEQAHGLAPLKIENHVDMFKVMNAANQGETTKYHLDAREALGSNQALGKRTGSLGEHAASLGIDIDAHFAVSDTGATLKLGTTNIPGMNKPVYQHALDTFNDYTNAKGNKTIELANKDSHVLFANKAVKLDKNSWDHVKGINGETKAYLDYGLSRGNFYTMEGFSFIHKDNLPEEMAKKISGNGLFSMKLKNAYEHSGDTVHLMRESMDDFQGLFQNNLSIHQLIESNAPVNHMENTVKGLKKRMTELGIEGRSKIGLKADMVQAIKEKEALLGIFDTQKSIHGVTRGMINSQTEAALTDNARRSFDAMFQLNTNKGFDHAERMYGTYRDANMMYANMMGDTTAKMTKGQVTTLIQQGHLDVNGQKLFRKDALEGIKNLGGKEVEERLTAFREMYNVMGDTHETMSGLIQGINNGNINAPVGMKESIAEQYIKKHKTLALQDAWQNIKSNVAIKTGAEVENKVLTPRTYADIAAAQLMKGDTLTTIKANTKVDASHSVYGLISGVGKDRGKTQQDIEQIKALKGIVGDLEGRGILPEGYGARHLSKAVDPYHTAHTVGADVFRVVEDARETFTTTQLLNIHDTLGVLKPGSKEHTIAETYSKLMSNKPLVMDSSGYKVAEKTLDAQVKSASITAHSIATNSVNKVTPSVYGGMHLDIKGKHPGGKAIYGMDDSLVNWLKNDLHYTDNNINAFQDMLYAEKYGMVSKYNYSVSIFEAPNKAGDMIPHLALTDQKSSHAVREAISKGEMPTNAVTFAMPVRNTAGPSHTVSVGRVEKGIIGHVETYVQQAKEDDLMEAYLRVTSKYKDTIDVSLGGYTKNHKVLQTLIQEKLFDRGSKTIHNAIMAPILDGPGQSGMQTVIRNGEKVKAIIPNISDYNMGKYVDSASTINYLPMLYENHSEIRDDIHKVLGGGEDGAKRAQGLMKGWKKQLGEGKYGTLKEYGSEGIELNEWYTKNFLNGHKIAEKIANSGDKMSNEYGAKMMQELLKHDPTQFIKESKTSEMFMMLDNPIEYNTYGFMTGLSRPVQNQWQSFHSIDLDEMKNKGENFINKLEHETGIRVGETVVTDKMFNNYLTDMAGKEYNIATGITGNYKAMDTEKVFDALDNTFARKNDVLNQINANLPVGQNHYTSEEFDTIFNKYKGGIGSTHEQHSLMNPGVKEGVWGKHELIAQTIDEDLLDSGAFEVGKDIDHTTVIGTKKLNGETREIGYKKTAGKITHRDGNTIFIEGHTPEINDIKVGVGGNEKTIASVVTHADETGKDFSALIQGVWNDAFGKDTTLIGNFELGKHESPYAYTRNLEHIAESVAGNKAAENELLSIMNHVDHKLSSLNAEFVTDPMTKKRVMKISGNPEGSNFFQGIEDLVGTYKGKTDDLSKKITKGIDEMNSTDTFRIAMRRMLLSESTPSKGALDEVGGKGLKVTARELQVFGLQTGEYAEQFRKFNGERYEKIAQPVIDYRKRMIKETAAYKEGLQEVRNMQVATLGTLGKSHGGVIKEVNLQDIAIPKGGVTAEDLHETIFNHLAKMDEGIHEGKTINAYKIQLPDGMKINNSLTNKATDHVIIPVMKSHMVDDMVFMSNTQKSVADLVTSLQTMQEGHSNGKKIIDFHEDVNNALTKMFLSMDSELNDKTGLVEKMMLSGKIQYSGQTLSNKIISPLFDTDAAGNKSYRDPLTKNAKGLETAIEVTADGKELYKNVGYMSKRKLENMGVDFTDIGHQVFTERLGDDENFRQHLIEKKLITKDNKLVTDAKFEHPVMPEYVKPEFVRYEPIPMPNRNAPGKVEIDLLDMKNMANEERLHFAPEKMPNAPVKPRWEDFAHESKINLTGLTGDEKFKAIGEATRESHAKQVEAYSEASKRYYRDIEKHEDTINKIYSDNLMKKYKLQEHNEKAKELAKSISGHEMHQYNADFEQKANEVYEQNLTHRYQVSEANKKIAEEANLAHEKAMETYHSGVSSFHAEQNRVKGLIGEEHMMEKGVMGSVLRYPTFLSTSELAINVKYSKHLDGEVSAVDPITAAMLNLDNDGDKISYALNLERTNGKTRLMSKDHEAEKAMVALHNAQAQVNGTFVGDALGKMNIDASKLGNNIDIYKNQIKELKGEAFLGSMNYLRDENVVMTAIKARHNKAAIGFVSTPNYAIRDIAGAIHEGTEEGITQLGHVIQFTNQTEQKLIDVKHVKNGGEQVSSAGMYKTGLKKIVNGEKMEDKAEGLSMLIKSVGEAQIYKAEHLPTVEQIMGGTADMKIAAHREINAVYNTLTNEKASKIWNSTLLKSNQGKDEQVRLKGWVDAMSGTTDVSSEILNSKKGIIDEASGLNGVTADGISIEKGQVLFSRPGSKDMPQSVYEFVDHGKGKVTGENYVKLKDVNSGKDHMIYGHTIDDISGKIGDNFVAPISSNADAIVKKTTVQQANKTVAENVKESFIENSMTDHNAFKRSSIESEVFNSLYPDGKSAKMNVGDVVDSVMAKHGVNSDNLREELMGLDKTLSHNEKMGRANAHTEFFNTEHGKSVGEMASAATIVEQKSKVEGSAEKLIRQFNEDIKTRGAKPREEVMGDMIANNIPGPQTNKASVVGHITEEAEKLGYTHHTPQASKMVTDTIGAIGKEEMFNIRGVEQQLVNHLHSQKISEDLIEKYGKEQVDGYAKHAFVGLPLQGVETHQFKANTRMTEHFSTLAHDGSEEAMKFLNWHSTSESRSLIETASHESVKKLGESKVAFGEYVGASLNELSMADLKTIHGATIDETMKLEHASAIRGTQERIGMYFEAADKLGAHSDSSMANRATDLTSRNLLSQDKLNSLGDLNDSIRSAGEAAAQKAAQTTVKLENETLKHAGDIIEGLGGWKKAGLAGVVAGGIALGLASATAGFQYTAPTSALKPERKPNGSGSPGINGDYDGPSVTPRVAPPSDRAVRLDGGSGVKYNISAKANGSVEASSISDVMQRIVKSNSSAGPNLNVSLNTQDDTRGISDQWLKGKVKNLIN